MSDFDAQKFIKAFNDASSSDTGGLTKHHKKQLDGLQSIVDALNAEGTFVAELTDWVRKAPGLDIRHKDDKTPVSFQVSFGFDAFGGSPSIVLTTSAAATPISDKKNGYLLPYDAGRLLEDLGKAVAGQRAKSKVSAQALAYVTRKKAPDA